LQNRYFCGFNFNWPKMQSLSFLNLRSLTVIIYVLISGISLESFSQVKDGNTFDFVNSSAQINKPYVILISGDGFRYDYAQKYQAKNLLRLAGSGVSAKYMIPSYPSVTHPNHYTLITGLYPGHHGIIGNSFYDPLSGQNYDKSEKKWFKAESVWETAAGQQMITANINWVNGRTIGKGVKFLYQAPQKIADINTGVKVNILKDWLTMPEGKRPHLITLYFNNTDHAGHEFGPDSPETARAVAEIDEAVGLINSEVAKLNLPVNFIFVSDHGMIPIDKKNILAIPTVIDSANFVINNQNSLVNLYAKNKALISPVYEQLKKEAGNNYQVYLNGQFPSRLHYGGKDDVFQHSGDIILVPIYPKTFNPKAGPGMHGFDPVLNEQMGATFMAWGPAFKKGLTIEPFENVEVYSLITNILGLKPASNDGSGKLAKQVLN